MTQIRCAASEIRIWSSLVAPFLPATVHGGPLGLTSAFSGCGPIRLLQPRIIPRFIPGQWGYLWGQSSFAIVHILFTASAMQLVRICSIDSVMLQVVHIPLCS